MTQETKKPTDKLKATNIDGKIVTDSTGKVYVLRQPDILDQYDFAKALGDDASNANLFSLMLPVMFIAKIDGQVFETPRVYSECRAALKRVGQAGVSAIRDVLTKVSEEGEGAKEEIKK